VLIGKDTVIGPNKHLLGRTVVGEQCLIDGNAYVPIAGLGMKSISGFPDVPSYRSSQCMSFAVFYLCLSVRLCVGVNIPPTLSVLLTVFISLSTTP